MLLLGLLAACSAAPGPAAAPTPAPPEARPQPLPAEPAHAPSPFDTVQPGRFDTGKMWTFETPPLDYFEEAYGFRPSGDWLRRVRLAALRLPNCSASFASPRGLVMTNHHCARESATAVSSGDEDLLERGFSAAQEGDERRVPELAVEQLIELSDVTALVEAAGALPGTPPEAATRMREERAQEVGDSLSAASALDCQVTALYNGARYSAYCYRRYEDVRLVFVPEGALGYFGGDPDNFTYPRYALDVAFFRVYGDDGQPLAAEHFFPWSASGPADGEPVFVVGNPGSTSRLNTVAQLEYKRDIEHPFFLRMLESRARAFEEYLAAYPERRPEVINDYFSITNALKATRGELAGLRDPVLMARKVAFEREFRGRVEGDSALRREYGGLWHEIAGLRAQIAEVAPTLNGLNQGGLLRSATLELAALMVQYARAVNAPGVPESTLAAIRGQIEGTEVDTALDRAILAAQLEDARMQLGSEDRFVRAALAGESPPEAASRLLARSALPDPKRRAALLAQPGAVDGSGDPILRLMRDLLPRLIQASRDAGGLEDREAALSAKLGRALYAVYGTAIPPDATFTLRIADGIVDGYEYNGTMAPAFTTFYGLYDRYHGHAGASEWALPERWLSPPAGFDLGTPLNLVTTNDIIGGNSGSPLINTAGEIVGVIFDGNIESLSGDFIYTTRAARAVAVHSEGILEALRDLYRAMRLVAELEAARTGATGR